MPRTEQRSQWDCNHISKEIFMNALNLKVIGNITPDDEAMTDANFSGVNENNENLTEVNDNPQENRSELVQNNAILN